MKFFFFFLFSIIGVIQSSAQVLINEFMQSNVDCIMDNLNEFPDSWVELYNAGEDSVNLSDYRLGISNKVESAYCLPSFVLAPKECKIVYCDKNENQKKWHAPFRLESGKDGAVYLFLKDEIVDKVEKIKKQPAPNIAYGRKFDGVEEWGYQLDPTPGSSNKGNICNKDDILKDPVFSLLGRVLESSQTINLSLFLPDGSPDGTEIYYTIDGSEPAKNSISTQVYDGNPLTIDSSITIRAKLFCDGYLSPRSIAQSFIFLDREMTLPVVSLAIDEAYFYSDDLGIYNQKNNNINTKNDWRRPVNIEYFENPNEESKINQLGETRVSGGASRDHVLKSLILYANKRFHEQKRFSYEFFPEDRPGKTEFKSLMLRNAGNDFTQLYMRDAIIQRSFARYVDIDFQGYSPTVVYLNGRYLGLLNLRERSNEDNIYTNYDKLEDIDMFENWKELKVGTKDNKLAFESFYNEVGHTWDEYEKWMDCTEFINLMIMNIFYNNQDFPGNNIVMWRPATNDGRWRWIAKDTDFGLALGWESAKYKTLNWLYDSKYDSQNNWGNKEEYTLLFRQLMEDPNFRREFIDRCAIYMGDFLNFDSVWKIWSPMYERIKKEHSILSKTVEASWGNYSSNLDNSKKWLKNRPACFYEHLAEFFELGVPTQLEINPDLSDHELDGMNIKMNGVHLSSNRFNGKFFRNREFCLSDDQASAWQIEVLEQDSTVTQSISLGSTCRICMPNCLSVKIKSIKNEPDGIDRLFDINFDNIIEYFDVRGVKHNQFLFGINLVRMGDGSLRKIIKK